MRDAIEKLIADSVAEDWLSGSNGCGRLIINQGANCLVISRRLS